MQDVAGSARSLRSLTPQPLASLALPERSSVEWGGRKREGGKRGREEVGFCDFSKYNKGERENG